ncbi:hypothetical protein [Streptomyces sp. NBC_00076]|uniref:hypothetical protein n=1 Tax=Streptomyces sp. NBC_00076 TaxID=2975642 RepID=UPI00324353A4
MATRPSDLAVSLAAQEASVHLTAKWTGETTPHGMRHLLCRALGLTMRRVIFRLGDSTQLPARLW